jgi:hypothetical protein
MPNTYTLISSNVLGSSAASVTFSAIPSTYTDLVLRMSLRSDESGQTSSEFTSQLNGTSANYSLTRLRGNGSTASSSRISNAARFALGEIPAGNSTTNTFTATEIYIPSYTASQNKPLSSKNYQENNNTSANIHIIANLWRDTSAITSISFAINGGFNFVSGSSFYLYGIKNS